VLTSRSLGNSDKVDETHPISGPVCWLRPPTYFRPNSGRAAARQRDLNHPLWGLQDRRHT